jgi:chromosomal replication initiator protein
VQHGAQIWQQILTELKGIMTESNYATWLQNTRGIEYDGNILTISVPSMFTKEYLEKRIQNLIGRTMQSLGYGHLQLRYTVVAQDRSDLNGRAKPGRTNSGHSTFGGAAGGGYGGTPKGAPDLGLFGNTATNLNPRYVFETFIQGGGNRFAYAACTSVSENPARRFNPLFIWGSVGLGKTHLLHAIGHQVIRLHPEKRVLYTSSEKFTNEIIASIQKGRTEEFRTVYRTVDVLLIDDIQFIAGKESTQEEFFHTFNTLHEAEKQIVMTSDKHPKAMTTLEDRLKSRFEWGLIADVQPPDLEHRIAILQAKAELQPVPVPRNVLEFIARRVQSNVRELEGTLTRITAMASTLGVPVNLDLAQRELETLSGGGRRSQPTLDEVMEAVLNHYKVDRQVMLSGSRERAIVLPRHVAMYLMREDAQCSMPRIGEYLGKRDHSTVMHGCERITEELKNENPQLRRDIHAIRSSMYESLDR